MHCKTSIDRVSEQPPSVMRKDWKKIGKIYNGDTAEKLFRVIKRGVETSYMLVLL